MTLFALLAGAAVLAVLALLLRPLLAPRAGQTPSRSAVNAAIYRDQLRELEVDLAAGTLAQSDYERAKKEIESRVLEEVAPGEAPARKSTGRKSALAVGVAVPLFAIAVYLAVGNPLGVLGIQEALTPHQVEVMVERLAAQLRENPEDVEGWKMLGRSYAALERFDEAADAFAKGAVRAPRDAQLLADLAESLGMARGGRLEGEPEKLIARALEIEPSNLKALALAGSAAFVRRDFDAAVQLWERMLPQVAPDSAEARTIRESIEQARSLAANKHPGVRGTISLAPALKGKASPEDVVYVFARAAEGPPMPLAVAKLRVKDLPYAFRLDDSMAMTPEARVSAFPRVVVTARVAKSGNVAPQSGDLQGASGPVASDAEKVDVVIDNAVP